MNAVATPVTVHRPLAAEEAARADFYALLSRLFQAAPDGALLHSLANAEPLGAGGDGGLAKAWRDVVDASTAMDEEAALDEYDALFGSVGRSPVSLYAGIFLLVNVTYLLLCWEVVDRPDTQAVSPHARRMMRTRSLLTIGIFAAAVLAALVYPAAGMALICVCLLLYLRPDPPGENSKASAEESTL